jgi:hypothetical protein
VAAGGARRVRVGGERAAERQWQLAVGRRPTLSRKSNWANSSDKCQNITPVSSMCWSTMVTPSANCPAVPLPDSERSACWHPCGCYSSNLSISTSLPCAITQFCKFIALYHPAGRANTSLPLPPFAIFRAVLSCLTQRCLPHPGHSANSCVEPQVHPTPAAPPPPHPTGPPVWAQQRQHTQHFSSTIAIAIALPPPPPAQLV